MYVYARSGSYNISLTVTDSTGLTATAAPATITVNAVSEPTASFTSSPSAPNTMTLVQFNAAASSASGGRTIVSYVWDFGDGTTVTGTTATTSHTFAAAPGEYTVTLTVTDRAGATGTTSNTVTVT